MNDNNNEELQNDCYEYIAAFSKEIYENESRRKDAIIRQASNTQTTFSFMSAAVLMAAPVVVEYRGVLSLTFLLIAFSSILLALLLSLLFATIAQQGRKRTDYPSVKEFKEKVENDFSQFLTPAQRSKYLSDTYQSIHASFEQDNETRVGWINRAHITFYCALGLCVFWFTAAIIKII